MVDLKYYIIEFGVIKQVEQISLLLLKILQLKVTLFKV